MEKIQWSIGAWKRFLQLLKLEDITDPDYSHAKRVLKDFEIKNLRKYHDLYVQGNTLFLADVFENFRNICLRIYEFDPARFLTAPGLAWKAALKKIKLKLNLLSNINMLLMVEKDIRGGICHSIYWYGKVNNKYMKVYDKINRNIFNIGMKIIYIDGQCHKSCLSRTLHGLIWWKSYKKL